MKIDYTLEGRKIYKFSSSVCQGGYFYAHKSRSSIENKYGLRNALIAVVKRYGLIDELSRKLRFAPACWLLA